MTKRGTVLAGVCAAAALLAGCSLGGGPAEPSEPPTGPGATPTSSATPTTPTTQPNIVFVLTDDLSSDLVPYMRNVQALAAEGISFDDYFVSNSLCCPSRASIFTGNYPHNTKVIANTWPVGGFGQFLLNDTDDTAATRLQDAGYRTGFLGKFLNQYEPAGSGGGDRPPYDAGYVPPGWNEWHAVGGGGYQEFEYVTADAVDVPVAQVIPTYGAAEANYLTDVMSNQAVDFIDRAADGTTATGAAPFFLEVSTFGTHNRVHLRDPESNDISFPAAPRDRPAPKKGEFWPSKWAPPEFRQGDCGDPVDGGCDRVQFPPAADAAIFGRPPVNGPDWISEVPPTTDEIAEYRSEFLQRIQMAQSIDVLVGRLRTELAQRGLLDNTYLVFSSDNGYHLGTHNLTSGKRTAFDSDIRVPLIIRPPSGANGAHVDAIVQNVDLTPTFVDLAGGDPGPSAFDGRSFAAFLRDPALEPGVDVAWRAAAFVEQRLENGVGDPDADEESDTPGYNAIRTATYLYVDYSLDLAAPALPRVAEFYDLRSDPMQTVNRYGALSQAAQRALAMAAADYAVCVATTCRDAEQEAPAIEDLLGE
jgi:arylsulfatase A-like enzyme